MPPSEITPIRWCRRMSTTIEPVADRNRQDGADRRGDRSRSATPWTRPPQRGIADRAPLDLVEPQGTQMMMRGWAEERQSSTFLTNCFMLVTVKSAITPSFIGCIRGDVAGVRRASSWRSNPTSWITRLPLGRPSWRMETGRGPGRARIALAGRKLAYARPCQDPSRDRVEKKPL